MSFKDEVVELGADQESGEWLIDNEEGETENLSGESKNWSQIRWKVKINKAVCV